MRLSARGAVARIDGMAPGWGTAGSGLWASGSGLRGSGISTGRHLAESPKPEAELLRRFGLVCAVTRGAGTRRTQEERPPVRERDVPSVRAQGSVLGLV